MSNVVYLKPHTKNPLYMRLTAEDYEYIEMMREEFTLFVSGFRYMPAYKCGNWSGKVCLMGVNNILPYGLLMDFVRIHKKNFLNNRLVISDEIKEMFRGPHIEPKWNLSLYPYDYQEDCIRTALRYSKGIIRSATASGKSLIIVYIIKTLMDNYSISGVRRSLVVVPGTNLMTQLYSNMLEYGIDETLIGKVFANSKQWDKNIVISTWQTLSNNHDRLNDYDVIIVDECHGVKAVELKKILVRATSVKWRFGFTGTMPPGLLDDYNVKSFLGPVIKEYSSGELAKRGYISKCNIRIVNIEYNNEFEGTYDEVKDEVFNNPYRMKLVKNLISKLDHNSLILVGKVEKEGEVIEAVLKNHCKDKETVFLSGRDDVEIREEWRKKCMKRDNVILIATYGIFQQGIDIPNLKYILLLSPFQSKIRVLQSVGRALRKHANKEKGAYIFDIRDRTKYLDKHGSTRERFYASEHFRIDEFLFEEGGDISMEKLVSL